MAGARHFEKMPRDQVREKSPCWTIDEEVYAQLVVAAQKLGQTPSRIVQAAIRYKTAQLRGKYQGIRNAYECFSAKAHIPPPTTESKTKYFTPSLFTPEELADET